MVLPNDSDPSVICAVEDLPLPRSRSDWALFLDVDGTLLEIASTPWSVHIPPDLLRLLASLKDVLGGALALVSGRTIADLDRLFAPLRFTAAGQHGGEVRITDDGPVMRPGDDLSLAEFDAVIGEFARTRRGVIVERKGLSTAVHYRLAEERREELRQFITAWLVNHRIGFQLVEGRAVFEVKLAQTSKLTAVGYLIRCQPFSGRVPIFVGDDRTDEDGFAAVIALGGQALHVGSGRASIANWRISDPAGVRAWLGRVVEALGHA
jgi:trehalose 6-phosphate phosphatase